LHLLDGSRRFSTVTSMIVDDATYVNGVRQDASSPAQDGSFRWIGLLDPSRRELLDESDHFEFNDFALEDALTTHQRPKIDQFVEHTFIVVRTVAYDGPGRPLGMGDLCLFVTDSTIMSVRHGTAMPLATIRADLQSRPERLAKGPTAVVHEIIDRLVDQYVDVGDRIANDVRAIEDSVFDDDVPAVPQELYAVKRELIEFRRAVTPMLEPLTQLASGSVAHIDAAFRFDFSDVRDHLLRVLDQLEALDRIMDAALQANLALITVKQNEDMRKISAWAGMAAVPTMIAGIYGMNFENMPELSTEWGYFIVVGLMVGITISLHRLFRRNKWL
jgi:magnesium transporter